MARTGRPITLPGIWGPLAASTGGVQVFALRLGVPERSLRNWACNTRSMDAVVAGKVWDILDDTNEVSPILYRDPADNTFHIASIPDGWVAFPRLPRGWEARFPWKGDPSTLERGDIALAVRHGWPYGENR